VKLVEAIKLFGGLGGLAFVVFLIYDRVVRSKPLAYLIPQEYRVHLRVINMTRETVIVDRVTTKPPGVVELVWGSDTRSELEAAAAALWPSMADDERAKKFLVLRPSEERSLAIQHGSLDELQPGKRITIRCRWRNTRSLLSIRRSVSVYTTPHDLARLKEVADARGC